MSKLRSLIRDDELERDLAHGRALTLDAAYALACGEGEV